MKHIMQAEVLPCEAQDPGNNQPAAPQDPGTAFAGAWERYKATVDGYAKALAGISAELCRATAGQECIDVPSNYQVTEWKEKVAKSMRRALIALAATRFAPPGAHLKIDEEPIAERFPLGRDEQLASFNPAAIWQYLVETYGGQKGEQEALRQAANQLVNCFRLRRDQEVQTTAGCVVLNLPVYVDVFDKKYSNVARLHYRAREDFCRALGAFEAFAHHIGRLDLASDLAAQKGHWGVTREIVSRARHALGAGDILLVTFTTRFEFRLRQALAEQLQIFLGTYADSLRE